MGREKKGSGIEREGQRKMDRHKEGGKDRQQALEIDVFPSYSNKNEQN